MKKITNALEHYTDDMLRGIYVVHPGMVEYVEDDLRCCYTAKKRQGRVAIVTGGDTGHLPLFLGYVGENLLDGCGVGSVFRSPPSERVYSVAKEVEVDAEVLLLHRNYTGDIMDFDMAAEMLDMDDIRTANIVGADDVLSDKDAQVRRGVTGIFLMYKYAGARIARTGTLEEMLATAEKAKENTRTIGFTLMPCVIPEIGHSSFTLTEDEMVFGMGIHGEPGMWNGPVKTANELAEESVGEVLINMPLNPGEEVYILTDGLGVTGQEELCILSEGMHRLLEEKRIRVYRAFVEEYVTSMEMTGTFISIYRMADQEMK